MQTLIKGYTFTLSEPFHAGTVITKGEAQALNKLRVENIANNLRDLVNRAIAELGPDELIPASKLAEIQATITQYDKGYFFLEKSTGRSRLGDIEEEAKLVAKERVEAQLRQIGSTLSEEALAAAIAQNEILPAVIEEARLRVAARRRVSGEGLDSL